MEKWKKMEKNGKNSSEKPRLGTLESANSKILTRGPPRPSNLMFVSSRTAKIRGFFARLENFDELWLLTYALFLYFSLETSVWKQKIKLKGKFEDHARTHVRTYVRASSCLFVYTLHVAHSSSSDLTSSLCTSGASRGTSRTSQPRTTDSNKSRNSIERHQTVIFQRHHGRRGRKFARIIPAGLV